MSLRTWSLDPPPIWLALLLGAPIDPVEPVWELESGVVCEEELAPVCAPLSGLVLL
jgi:hypothetical protein